MKSKLAHCASTAAFVVVCISASLNQTAREFAPLDQWKAAITKHDAAALKSLYAPAAQISTPSGAVDSDADIAFWIGLKVRRLKTEVVQSDSPDPDQRRLILKMEIHSIGPTGERVLYMSTAELWKHDGDQWRLMAMKRTDGARLEQPLVVSNDIYSPGSDARTKIKDAMAAAAKEHKRVILVFGANWCFDCHVLDTAFHRADLAAVLEKNYEVVHIDVGRGDANQDLMEQYKVPMKKGIPGLAVLDSNGTLLFSQQNGEFENARSLGPEDLLAFLNKWKPGER